jgi:hypothetical protein
MRSASTTCRESSRKSPTLSGVDDVDPLREGALVHHGNQLGRILQVGVHRDDVVAVRVIQPGGERQLVPDIAREQQGMQLRPRRGHLAQHLAGAVAGAVVDHDDLVGLAQAVEHRAQPPLEQRQDLGFVVAGDDHGQAGA